MVSKACFPYSVIYTTLKNGAIQEDIRLFKVKNLVFFMQLSSEISYNEC